MRHKSCFRFFYPCSKQKKYMYFDTRDIPGKCLNTVQNIKLVYMYKTIVYQTGSGYLSVTGK